MGAYTVCLQLVVHAQYARYGHDNLRSDDISVWQQDAGVIKTRMIFDSDVRVDCVKAPPYMVIQVIVLKSRKKHEQSMVLDTTAWYNQ